MSEEENIILIADPDEGVAELLQEELVGSGFSTRIETTSPGVIHWLERHEPLLMLLDLELSGPDLLKELESRQMNIPFVIVSATSDVRAAVEVMKRGALDFLFKDSTMLGLVGPVVERSVNAIKVQRELEEARTRLTEISEVIDDVFWMTDANCRRFLYVSPAYEKIWGKPVSNLYANVDAWADSVIKEDRSKFLRARQSLCEGYESEYDESYRIHDSVGRVRWIRDRGYVSLDGLGRIRSFSGVASDITARKELEREVVEAAEHERIRIGQELHDDLCQRLAALKLTCDRLAKVFKEEGNGQTESLREMAKQLAEATSLSRLVARGLSPVSLEVEGLMMSLEHLADDIEGRFGIMCRFDCPEPISVNNPVCASHVFRIAQELATNAAKHAHPKRIWMSLYRTSGGFKLEVVNDGIPFHDLSRKNCGMGLHFIRFRADAIGASLEFIPGKVPDGGTRVVCLVPNRRSNLNDADREEPAGVEDGGDR